MSGNHAATAAPSNSPGQVAQCVAKHVMGAKYMAFEVVLAAKDAAARIKALAVLSDPALKGIQFSIPTAKISTKMLARVLARIMVFELDVRVWQSGVPGYSGGAGAMYDKTGDTLYVDLDTKTRFSRTNVVHEAVHAAHDLDGDKNMTGLASETVAYITECVYQLNRQPKTDVRSLWYDPGKENDIYMAAWPLAEKVLGRGGNTSKTTNLQAADLVDLEKAIKAAYGPSIVDPVGFNGFRNKC